MGITTEGHNSAGVKVYGTNGDPDPREVAESDGYYTDAEGVRRKILAGSPLPVGATLEAADVRREPTQPEPTPAPEQGESEGEKGEGKARRTPPADKSRKGPDEHK